MEPLIVLALVVLGFLLCWLFYSIADRLKLFPDLSKLIGLITGAWRSGRRHLGKDRP